MKFNRSSYINTRRDAWVEINLDHVEHNVREIKKLLPAKTKLLAVVKADAYGHGSVMTAPSLLASGVDFLGVASIDEGVQLREAGIKAPILVLGTVPVWSINSAAVNDITISIFSDSHIEACKVAYEKNGLVTRAHVKVDTGMNRIGINVDHAADFIEKVKAEPCIKLDGIFTHFACAENLEKTKKQTEKFNKLLSTIGTANLLIHSNNTAALLSSINPEMNMSRAGLAIYGLMPELDCKATPNKPYELKQAIGLKGRIASIHTAGADEGVSYSHTYTTTEKIMIATVPIGYADGVSRKLSNNLTAGLNGKIIKQIGNITMDQMMFDITGIDAKEGDIITLLGQDEDNFFSVDTWANALDTINYEITCRLKVRLARVYVRD